MLVTPVSFVEQSPNGIGSLGALVSWTIGCFAFFLFHTFLFLFCGSHFSIPIVSFVFSPFIFCLHYDIYFFPSLYSSLMLSLAPFCILFQIILASWEASCRSVSAWSAGRRISRFMARYGWTFLLLRFRFLVLKEVGGIVFLSFQCTCNLIVFSNSDFFCHCKLE